MGSKKYKNKTCVYCAVPNSSQVGDHIFAREFFTEDKRDNLPKAPACNECNGEKSSYEHYLTAVLPFAAQHEDALENFKEYALPRLANNQKLNRRLIKKAKFRRLENNGVITEGNTLPLDSTQIEKLFALIVRGLIWYHWKEVISNKEMVAARFLPEDAEGDFDKIIQDPKLISTGRQDLGKGTFIYEGFRDPESPHRSLWEFIIYGGLTLGKRKTNQLVGNRLLGMAGLDAPQGYYKITYGYGVSTSPT